MWIGSLALAGLPFFAGYYSKDMILEAAYAGGTVGKFAFTLGIAAAFMTAFYSWRLLFMTFHGKPRASEEVMSHVHESPPIMLRPLILLVLGSLFAGAIGANVLHLVDGHSTFWQATISSHEAIEAAHHVPLWVALSPILMGLSGIALAYLFYIKSPERPVRLAAKFPRLYLFLLNKWYFDELYDFLFVRPAKRLGQWLWKLWDEKIIDGFGPNGAALVTHLLAGRTSRLQTGYVYHYAFVMLIGVVALVSWVVVGGR
jgi:NADH-quinone oxidoreductase subunit L